MDLGIAIFVGCMLVCLAALPLRRTSKRDPENVVRLIPKSGPLKAEIRAAGQVLEFKPRSEKGK